MANQRVAELFLESLFIQQPLTPNRMDVSGQVEPGASVASTDRHSAGGGIRLGSQGSSGLLWSIDAEVRLLMHGYLEGRVCDDDAFVQDYSSCMKFC